MILQQRYFSYQRTFSFHEYGVWLEKRCMKRFIVIAVARATSDPESVSLPFAFSMLWYRSFASRDANSIVNSLASATKKIRHFALQRKNPSNTVAGWVISHVMASYAYANIEYIPSQRHASFRNENTCILSSMSQPATVFDDREKETRQMIFSFVHFLQNKPD